MDKIKQKKQVYYIIESERNVTNRIDNIPVWAGGLMGKCQLCNNHLGLSIAHGVQIEHFSIIELDNVEIQKVHTHCLNKRIAQD